MKRIIIFILSAVMLAGVQSCSTQLNSAKLVSATAGAVTALTLTDAQVAKLSRDAVAQMDKQTPIAPATSPYTQRLNRLTANIKQVKGLPLNFKVYMTKDINAFATGDGSIRVFSGLMDIMSDEELIAIIGHEIGHVANADVKQAMRNAYLTYAARMAISSTEGALAALTDSQLGDIMAAYIDAQYSQKQEFSADDYGFEFSIAYGYSPYSMYNSLQKLLNYSGGGGQASVVQKAFSSHPDTVERAARIKKRADNYAKK